ncbi:MAG: TonB-dependent receptor [Gemmatimonadaceae bacterium]|nr:TonB-dependent receptor [Gemmatimonadaceae bacterium]
MPWSLRALIACTAAAATPQLATAQGTLTGVVRRAADATPIVGASVSVPATGLRVLTDATGAFTIEIGGGRVVVAVTAIGFVSQRDTVTLAAGASLRRDYRLAPSAQELGGMLVTGRPSAGSVRPAPERVAGISTAGARSEVVALEGSDVNLAEKVGRQVFARVPGVLVYDMDGAGNQMNVSTRGLDPHRAWEFNVRHDGVMTNSDIYGYPASHYSVPLEAIEEIQLVRGTAALQYGAQFGGLLNYRTKGPDTTRAFSTEGSLTGGSFALGAAFGGVSGRVGRVDYLAYAALRRSDGFRESSQSSYDAQLLQLTWRARPSLRVRGQLARSYYLHQLPGPLTDAMFADDPRQATRSRNWYSPTITIPSLRITWTPSERSEIVLQASRLTGLRGSSMFVGFATAPDTAASGSGTFAPRVVDIDNFDSRTYELRFLQRHQLGGREAALSTGITIADNAMRRRQQGPGTTGDDYDLTVTGAFGRDLRYVSRGLSWYAEEMIALTPRWRVIPGLRLEGGVTRMTGSLAYYDPADTPRRVRHDYPLFGVRTEFTRSATQTFYGGVSESFRPMLLKDLLPENSLERTDPAMRDARGWTAEVGVRGGWLRGTYDVGVFGLRYDNRFGGLLRTDSVTPYLFKTNIGSAMTYGVEASGDARVLEGRRVSLRLWGSAALFHARYRSGTAVQDSGNVSLRGKRVEGVPDAIVRIGLTVDAAAGSLTLLTSHTTSSFADALNVRTPTANGARGLVPAYTVLDLSASRWISQRWQLRLAVSNLLDASYFTKRPAFYPGPGVWPSDGRAVQAGLSWTR